MESIKKLPEIFSRRLELIRDHITNTWIVCVLKICQSLIFMPSRAQCFVKNFIANNPRRVVVRVGRHQQRETFEG